MLHYTLEYTENNIECDGEDYTNLDEARDTAWEMSKITMREISIYEHFGVSAHVIETVKA